jgi:DNA-binding NarL/FixJ family response regulator
MRPIFILAMATRSPYDTPKVAKMGFGFPIKARRTFAAGLPSDNKMQGRGSRKGMKLLIADDHHLLADALAHLVRDSEAGASVVQVSSFDDVLRAMKKKKPAEIVLLDYDLPGMNGTIGLDRFVRKYPHVRCAIFSGNPVAEVASDALARGAAGVIPKNISAPAFFHALKLIQVGEKFIPAEIYEDIVARRKPRAKKSKSTNNFIRRTRLSRREVQVLAALVQGISNRMIGEQLGIKEGTIKLHLRRIYQKINVSNRTQAVKLAMARGLDRHTAR